MKINSFSTNQFAGICDIEKSFADGMNVVLGNNEAGKSTMIFALFSALTKSVNLNKRADAEFIRRAFPSNSANTADVSVEFSDGSDTMILEKIWDKSGREKYSKLKIKGGTMFRGIEAESRLQEILKYGNAVYDNLIFGRQSNEENILSWCYDFFSEQTGNGFDETRKKLSEAFSAVDGISAEKLLEKLDEKLNELGNNWDYENDCPKNFSSKKHERRQKNVGIILNAYYNLDDLKKEYRLVSDNEQSINEKNKRISELNAKKIQLEKECDSLISSTGKISSMAAVSGMLEKERDELAKAENDAIQWDKSHEMLESAEKLINLSKRMKKAAAFAIISELKAVNDFFGKYLDISADYKKADELSRSISSIDMLLNTAKFTAHIIPENGSKISVSTADGDVHNISEADTVSARGFINIDIPNTAKIIVSSEKFDAEKIRADMLGANTELNGILEKYDAENIGVLENILNECNEKSYRRRELENSLSGYDAESLEFSEGDDAIPENPESMISDFLKNTGMESLEFAVGHYRSSISRFEEEYSDRVKLRIKIDRLKESISVREAEISEYSGLPQMSVPELEAEIQRKKSEISEAENTAMLLAMQKAELETENRSHDDVYEIQEKIDEAKLILNNEKKKYSGYMQIKRDFERIREESSNKLIGFYNRFNEYLSYITDNRISMECSAEKLIFRSEKNDIAEKPMLSEGTKKTILLAFRLAVLGYFFPDGGGLIVLDDDLLDMDKKRRMQSAELLKKFAEKNQVIFATCDESIAELLGGNIIDMNQLF